MKTELLSPRPMVPAPAKGFPTSVRPWASALLFSGCVALAISAGALGQSGQPTDEITGVSGCLNEALDSTPDDCEELESLLTNGSLLIPSGLRYHTWSHDYVSHAGIAGCLPCGSGGGAGGTRLPELQFIRHTNPVSYSRPHLAFGEMMGLKTYDQSLRLERNKSHVTFDNFGAMNAKITTDFNPGLQAWTTIWRRDRGIAAIHLFDPAGLPITLKADRDRAHTAAVMRHDGTSSHFEIFWNGNGDGWGRLVALLDRHGNAIEIEYSEAHFDTTLNPIAAPAIYHRRSLIRDAYGREAHFTYQVIHGRHVVTRIDLPNGEHLSYAYGSTALGKPMVQGVTHPDGSQSSWSVVDNSATKLIEVTIHDSKADPGHRRKKIFLTKNQGFAPGGGTMTVVKNRTRRVQDGAGEFVYDTRFTSDLGERLVYAGGNSVIKMSFPNGNNGLGRVEHVTNGLWVGAFHGGDPATWTTETDLAQRTNNSANFPMSRQDNRGRTTSHTRDPLSLEILTGQHPDSSASTTTRNPFSQPLTTTDRLGRQTVNTYSPLGDLLACTVAVGSDDEATYVHLYNARGQTIESRDPLYDGNFPELHNIRYEYDADGFLIKEIQAADGAGGTRPETHYSYDAAGRLASVTDPVGRVTSFAYDAENRLVETAYPDTTTEIVEYGEGLEANLVVRRIDRNGIETTYSYDTADRTIETVAAANTGTPLVETCTYLVGTRLKETCVRDGSLTAYHYDHRNRLVGTTSEADANTQLTSATGYDELARRRSSTDPYGRSTYYLYDHNDRLTRTVTETVPGGLGAVPDIVPGSTQTSVPHSYQLTDLSGAQLETTGTHTTTFTCPRDTFLVDLPRDLSPNAPYTITDTIYDAAGQALIHVDPRGQKTWMEYDDRGRNTLTIAAVGSPDEIRTETAFDANSNLIEVRQPRYFSEGIGAIQLSTYTGRNLVESRTVAAGSPAEATESYTYRADGTLHTHTDFRGHVTTHHWELCCQRLRATIDRDGASTAINNSDANGNQTHRIVIGIDPTSLPDNNWRDPSDEHTVAEATTRYDGRDRPTHNTAWLSPLGEVNPKARDSLGTGEIPIANDPAAGLTTTFTYDDDLTDSVGIDATYPTQFATLAARGISFGPGATGSATAVTSPAAETTVQVRDALGRTVMAIDATGHPTTYHYDTLVAGAHLADGAPWANALPLAGGYLATTAIDPLGNATTSYSDGAGRTVAVEDAAGHVSAAAYDAAGNALITRAADGTGQDHTYDALGRRIASADLQEQLENTFRSWTYDAHGQALTATDASGAVASRTYDARGRTLTATDENGLTTTYTYDPNSNLLTLTDPDGKARSWTYDQRDLPTRKEYAGHTPGSSPGAAGHDAVDHTYDALGRPLIRTDQLGRDIAHTYDLAGRLIARTYHHPGGAIESQDTLAYDPASRLTSGHKGRYGVTTTFTYDPAGRPASEATTVWGKTYTLAAAYDPAGRPPHLTFPDGKVQQTTYDARSLPASLIYDVRRHHPRHPLPQPRRPRDRPHLRQRHRRDHLLRAPGPAPQRRRRHRPAPRLQPRHRPRPHLQLRRQRARAH
jgi:YD repeat-containing protein